MREIGTGNALVDVDGHRADVVLNRPEKRNAMNEDVLRDLKQAFEEVLADDSVRAIALLGEGPVFCAGMDLEMMRDRGEQADAGDENGNLLGEVIETIDTARVPTVVGIKRAAPAGAFELSLPADFRVISPDAKYGVIEVQLGTFPHGGATQRLPRLIGLAKAKELVLSGEFIDPAEAKQIGLVNEICDPERVDERARELADELAENAPLGMENARKALNAALDVPLDEGLAYERALGNQLDDTHDYTEGFTARIEGREPEFEGR
ncbi:enoyl-CoA hydratase/isomerase family protein [Natronolimnohabitans innermongolicus]|uniref:Enoyl-CoA hydratase/isomerase n=1 Tax=Natronolimnohabitans innermongolicus JCM 12255 TaxID=1227499 RepID=L9WLL9_9EURY|nr:enoyl-CoA hydratase/isomerase family protein [Natronolimnohabitans innermongolicus]ELY50380.1 enoyl-CoA hydratase/isomerase [Natronolimnohabitans innermongolicus JCM 12255]